MNRIKLHEEFVKELQKKIPQRSELINIISGILQMEKEPVSRRLSEKVHFSVHEMGLLAKELNLSIDSLLRRDDRCHWLPFILEPPFGVESMDMLYDIIDADLEEMYDVSREPTEYGTLFNSFPIEYYVHHPWLMKFMFFKWGHYFVGTDEFNDFSKWTLSDRLADLKERMESILVNCTHSLYIWDETLIWTLVNEINFFYKMEILNTEDLKNIKNDLKEALVNLEKYISGKGIPERSSQNVSFYVSNMNLGVSSSYMFSERKKRYSFKTNFTFMSSSHHNYHNHYEVRDWINSFKNIAVLISGSGPLDRKLFFLRQHKIIDDFLKIEE